MSAPPFDRDAAPTVLVCAGHDPSGGAGVDADREAIEAAGALARCAVTTNTDQDGRRVRSFVPVPADAWSAQARQELREPGVAALKFGLLVGPDAIRAAASLAAAARARGLPVVVDPVLAASGGERFVDPSDLPLLTGELFAAGAIVTPNLPEAAELSGLAVGELGTDDGRLAAARRLLALGAGAVVLKGGHGGEDPVRDLVLARDQPPEWAAHPRAPGAGIHGSGCRHASALAAHLAHGRPLPEAARASGRWLAERIARQG